MTRSEFTEILTRLLQELKEKDARFPLIKIMGLYSTVNLSPIEVAYHLKRISCFLYDALKHSEAQQKNEGRNDTI